MHAKTPSPTALTLTLATALALSACSGEKSEEPAAYASEAAADSGAATSSGLAGPDIGGKVAPGVAFTYNYAFTLPGKSISGVQREHAAACEKLGTARCRVTGMTYDQPDAETVSARLNFLLAPDLAHRFASDGIAAVERAEGTLDNASVNGEDAGGAITLSQQDSAAIAAEVARLEGRLKAKGLGDGERRDLEARLSELRGQLRSEEQLRRGKEASVASTPVSFSYASQGVLGKDAGFGQALAASWNGLESTFGVLLLIAGILLPWLALAGLAVFGWRWLRRRNAPLATSPAEPTPTP